VPLLPAAAPGRAIAVGQVKVLCDGRQQIGKAHDPLAITAAAATVPAAAGRLGCAVIVSRRCRSWCGSDRASVTATTRDVCHALHRQERVTVVRAGSIKVV
jgi:hypothetical protein